MDDMTVTKIGYILCVVGVVGFYMSLRYLKILIVSGVYKREFYKVTAEHFQESAELVKHLQNELKEMIGEDGELIDKSREEEWEVKMGQIAEQLAFGMSLVGLIENFNKHIDRANSNALWDWWKVNVHVEEYILKDAITYINKRR